MWFERTNGLQNLSWTGLVESGPSPDKIHPSYRVRPNWVDGRGRLLLVLIHGHQTGAWVRLFHLFGRRRFASLPPVQFIYRHLLLHLSWRLFAPQGKGSNLCWVGVSQWILGLWMCWHGVLHNPQGLSPVIPRLVLFSQFSDIFLIYAVLVI